MEISPLGDAAVVIRWGDRVEPAVTLQIRAWQRELTHQPLPGTVDVVPAFASLAVFFARPPEDFSSVQRELVARQQRLETLSPAEMSQVTEIPVCYGGDYGPDLGEVARHARLSETEVVTRHAGADYDVNAIGFAPGFPYLGGLPPELATPRRATPRTQVPAGSVGIGGAQTGIYPFASPGGWHLIGRTPWRLFDPHRTPPARLQAGDRVRFRRIEAADFEVLALAEANAVTGIDDDPGRHDACLTVVRPGMFTTVQDLGRVGFRAQGVPQSGAADAWSLRLANLLVGNPEDAAGLEFTLVGPELEFQRDALVALAGADFGLPRWQPRWVRAGERLALGGAAQGCRGYLAIAGGIDLPVVLGSRSTCLRGQFGGQEGRVLRAGDRLAAAVIPRRVLGRWHLAPEILPAFEQPLTVRICPGAQAAEFEVDWAAAEFEVSAHVDRMGVRLGGVGLPRKGGAELLSSPVAPGTVQVPPDGRPIILLADAQTIGGYPQLGHVISADLPRAGQLRPGDRVRFQPVSREEAVDCWRTREAALGLLREGLAGKLA